MFRTFFCIAVLGVFPMLCQADQKVTETETFIRLNVTPMAAPKPALRYLLLPELKEINPGNPIQNYLKCFAEQRHFFYDKESQGHRDKLVEMPLDQLPAKDLQNYGNPPLRQADWAARLDKADWQILLKLKTDGFNLALPDLQMMRLLAQALKVRFRVEVALHRYDDAIRTAKTMFALSHHVGEHPTLIGNLVGIAIAYVTIGPLEEMLEQPGCPNLYWALTVLPTPMASIDHGLQGERALAVGEFRDLQDRAPMSKEQLEKFVSRLDELFGMERKSGKPDGSIRTWLDARSKDEEFISVCRRRLVEAGLPQEPLMRFPADQVILLDQMREFEVRRDDLMKLMNLPAWQVEAQVKQIKHEGESPLVRSLVAGLVKVRRAQGRLDQRIALLRHVEALRLYAADHNGRLPATLADVSVPLPDDPFTGKPFPYELKEGVAYFRGSPPPSMEKNPAYNVRYEVTIRK